MKKLLTVLLALLMCVTMVACSGSKGGDTTPVTEEEGKVLNIWTWNEEFWGFLCDYYADEKIDDMTAKKGDVTIKRTTYPSDGGAYQDALDAALAAQDGAAADEKVDLFLAEADYILKYTHSSATMDVTKIGVTDFSNCYPYTVSAASDENGVVKGISFQCCPAAMIYRRSIMKDVIGSDDPADVQAAVSDWAKFDAVAAQAKEKGYYMLATTEGTYRVFSNNCTSAWVVDGKLNIDANIQAWMDQSEEYLKKGYAATTGGMWDGETTDQMLKAGKSIAFFGPAWYFNFNMGKAVEETYGDWAICQGPQAHFWGGTWLLAATGTDNPTMVAEIMNTFINDEEVCSKLVVNNAQFTNNKKVNTKYAEDPEFGNAFLGGQNDTALFVSMADNIKFENKTNYDQIINEKLTANFKQYLDSLKSGDGAVTKDMAIANFKDAVVTAYPNIVVE